MRNKRLCSCPLGDLIRLHIMSKTLFQHGLGVGTGGWSTLAKHQDKLLVTVYLHVVLAVEGYI
jgi:hypothetical protein